MHAFLMILAAFAVSYGLVLLVGLARKGLLKLFRS